MTAILKLHCFSMPDKPENKCKENPDRRKMLPEMGSLFGEDETATRTIFFYGVVIVLRRRVLASHAVG